MNVDIGIDEAGRGCVLGPLFVGSASFFEDDYDGYLRGEGFKDSKKLSAKKIAYLYELLV